MFKKVTSFLTGVIAAFLSLFGINFEHTDRVVDVVDFPATGTYEPNENTDKLQSCFDELMKEKPQYSECIEKKPYEDDDRISAVFFSGANGTKTFAYIGIPEDASETNKVPAMVLVHGGAGHAYAEWVQYWVNKGFAAISADNFGFMPTDGYYEGCEWIRNPDHPEANYFADSEKNANEQWFFHYIANTVIANNILRADSRINTEKIGVTGISWGGLATSVTIGYDSRFAFAVPVYGCGFLHESKGYFYGIMSPSAVADVWEPSHLLSKAEMPVLWISGDNDMYFSSDALTKSAMMTKNSQITIIPNMPHGQQPAAYSEEVYRFVKSQVDSSSDNIKVTKISFDEDRAIVSFSKPDDVRKVSACVYYMEGEIEYNGRELVNPWKKQRGIVLDGNANIKIPEGAKYFYVSLEGKTGSLFSPQSIYASTGVYDTSAIFE